MKQKRHTTEEIIRIIREAASGKDLEAFCRQHNIVVASFYRWKKKDGSVELNDARKHRKLEKKNSKLKKILADSLLEIRVLVEVNAKKWAALGRSGGVRQNGGSARWAAAGPAGTAAAWAA